ncbi:MAG: hypothetical protein P9L89_06450 [Candidatus Celaenobacter polaris]|nr:hypothetical protein [Candidatus Celaenobacter polaris]
MNFKNTKEIYCNIKSKATTALQFKILKYFLSSITTEEVIKLFWENENDPDLYDFLKKMINENANNDLTYKTLIEPILLKLPEKNYRKEVKYRTILDLMMHTFSESTKLKIFFKFIGSERKSNREFAYKVSSSIQNSTIEKILKDNWNKYKDESLLAILYEKNILTNDDLIEIWEKDNNIETIILLINNNALSIEKHLEVINTIIKSEEIEDWIKRKCYQIIASKDINNIKFLKETEPVTFLYLMAVHNQIVDDKYIFNILNSLDNPDLLNLVFWCVSKMGKSNLLYKIFEKIDFIENRINENIRKVIFCT